MELNTKTAFTTRTSLFDNQRDPKPRTLSTHPITKPDEVAAKIQLTMTYSAKTLDPTSPVMK